MDAGPAPLDPPEEKAGLAPSRGALLASLPPGAGHLRNRQWGQGLLLLAGSLFSAYVAANPAHYAIPPPPWGLAAAGLAVFLVFWLYAARDLERAAGTDRDASIPRGRGPRGR